MRIVIALLALASLALSGCWHRQQVYTQEVYTPPPAPPVYRPFK